MNWKKWLLVGSIALNLVLLAGLFAGPFLTDAVAQNRTTTSAGGGFVMAAARGRSSAQAVYVVDTRSKRLIVYAPQATGGPLKMVDARNLVQDFGPEFSGDVIMLPFEVSNSLEAVTVIDTVGRHMVTYINQNFGRLAIIDSRDLAKEFQQ